MFPLSTSSPYGGAQRTSRYMKTDPRIFAGFDDLEPTTFLEPQISNAGTDDTKSFGVSSSSDETITADLKFTPRGRKAATRIDENKSARPSIFGNFLSNNDNSQVPAHSACDDESFLSFEEMLEADRMDLDTPKSKDERSPKTPQINLSPLNLRSPVSTPTKEVKRSRGRRSTNTTPRKKIQADTAMMTPKPEHSSSTWMGQSLKLAVTPMVSPPDVSTCFDDLPVFGLRYSRSSNSAGFFVSKPNAQTTTLNECDQICEAGGSVVGVNGSGVSPSSKKRPFDFGRDDGNEKRSKVIKLKFKKTYE